MRRETRGSIKRSTPRFLSRLLTIIDTVYAGYARMIATATEEPG